MKKWIDTLEEHLIKWLVGGFLTIVGTGIIFYFDASTVMAQNTKDIQEVKTEVKKINNMPEINTLKINQLAKEMMEQKQLTKDFQQQYSKDKDIIIQLLIDIKRKQ